MAWSWWPGCAEAEIGASASMAAKNAAISQSTKRTAERVKLHSKNPWRLPQEISIIYLKRNPQYFQRPRRAGPF